MILRRILVCIGIAVFGGMAIVACAGNVGKNVPQYAHIPACTHPAVSIPGIPKGCIYGVGTMVPFGLYRQTDPACHFAVTGIHARNGVGLVAVNLTDADTNIIVAPGCKFVGP